MITKDLLLEYDVILASQSPRRKELLQLICDNFRIIPSDCEEKIPQDILPEMIAEYLSNLKCRCIAEIYDNSLVIGCDTVVICDGVVLGKPVDEKDAGRMLSILSGKTHKVITGCTLAINKKYMSFSVETKVKFRNITDEQIAAYIATGEPMDKAGAYGIQGVGSLLVEKIDGDYFNVVGLPVSELAVQIRNFLNYTKINQ